jgi:hypothetical protein
MCNKILTLLLLSLIGVPALAGGGPSKICIQNKSFTRYYIKVVNVDSRDWRDRYDDGANNRPDANWQKVPISPSEVICRLADIELSKMWGGSVYFSFAISSIIGGLSPMLSPVRSVHYDNGSFHWALNRGKSSGMVPGMLSGGANVKTNWVNYIEPLPCLDPKDPDYKVCNMFVIKY